MFKVVIVVKNLIQITYLEIFKKMIRENIRLSLIASNLKRTIVMSGKCKKFQTFLFSANDMKWSRVYIYEQYSAFLFLVENAVIIVRSVITIKKFENFPMLICQNIGPLLIASSTGTIVKNFIANINYMRSPVSISKYLDC